MGASLENTLDALAAGAKIHLEHRPKRYMFGCLNYGDVPGYKNDADGDPWDIFAPGYEETLAYGEYSCIAVLGILMLDNGNHKIAVQIDHPGYDETRAGAEIRRYSHIYCKRVNVFGRWIFLTRSNWSKNPKTKTKRSWR